MMYFKLKLKVALSTKSMWEYHVYLWKNKTDLKIF